jgi:hypothetical protein
MDKVDRLAGITFKAAVVLYILAIAFQRVLGPNIYKMISMPLGAFVGLLLVYIGASWALKKLGYVNNGSITVSRKALVTTLGTVAAGILFVVLVEVCLHNLYLTQQATLDLQASTVGRDALGDPIRVGWYIDGYQRSDVASFSIPFKGSKAAGKLKLRGIRKDGSWYIVDLYLIMDGNGTIVQIPH